MTYEFSCNENWRKRHLPHYDAKDKYQSIKYRLFYSLPQNGFLKLKESLDNYKIEVEDYLDSGLSFCVLKESESSDCN